VDPSESPAPPGRPLSELPAGAIARIKRLTAASGLSQRLREMGLREEQTIRLLHHKANLICAINQTRIGLGRAVAEQIWVEPVASQTSA
jgi:Fe2+ transport system protein FeoA